MFCPNCGSKLDDNARFCANCGAPAAATPAPAEEPVVEPVAEPVVEPVAEPVVEEAPAFPTFEPAPAEAPDAAPEIPPIPTYIPPQYAQPAIEQPAPQGGKAFSILSLILGIFSMVLFWIPFFTMIPELLGLIFGIVGAKKGSGRGMAITGLVLSIVGLVLTLIITVLVMALTSEGLLVDSSFYY